MSNISIKMNNVGIEIGALLNGRDILCGFVLRYFDGNENEEYLLHLGENSAQFMEQLLHITYDLDYEYLPCLDGVLWLDNFSILRRRMEDDHEWWEESEWIEIPDNLIKHPWVPVHYKGLSLIINTKTKEVIINRAGDISGLISNEKIEEILKGAEINYEG